MAAKDKRYCAFLTFSEKVLANDRGTVNGQLMARMQVNSDPSSQEALKVNTAVALQNRREALENALREAQRIKNDSAYEAQDAGASRKRQVDDLYQVIVEQIHPVADEQRKAMTIALNSFAGKKDAYLLNKIFTHSNTNEFDDEEKRIMGEAQKEADQMNRAGPSNLQLQYRAFNVLQNERQVGGGKMPQKKRQNQQSPNKNVTAWNLAKEACRKRHGFLPRNICWACDSKEHTNMADCTEPNKFGLFNLSA
jgi:hypothetical protein